MTDRRSGIGRMRAAVWPTLALGLWACGTNSLGGGQTDAGTGGTPALDGDTGGTGGIIGTGGTGGTGGTTADASVKPDARTTRDSGVNPADVGTGGLVPKADTGVVTPDVGTGGTPPPADLGVGGALDQGLVSPDQGVVVADGGAQCIPSPERCNGLDDDCDGLIDNGDAAGGPLAQACYDGPAGTAGQGICVSGQQVCMGGAWQPCQGQVAPGLEICDLLDNNCDGRVDNLVMGGCACRPGTTEPCYGGPAGTEGIGLCMPGQHTCNAEGQGFGACVGQIVPGDEACDGLDNDCDGVTDNNLVGAGVPCGAGVGACAASGRMVCDAASGQIVCNAQEGVPSPELCNDLDDNCDGVVDEGWPVGDACGLGLGACAASGVLLCDANGGITCNAQPGAPQHELCNGVDDDCDGNVDNGFPVGEVCGLGAGLCESEGVLVCDAQGGVTCNAQPGVPQPERCNGADDDCDGNIDNGFVLGQACTVGVGACQNRGVTVCSGGAGAWHVAGVQSNLPEADVLAGGFHACWRGTYDVSGDDLDAIQAACAGSELMMACRPVGDVNLTLAAMGDRAEVLLPTGTPSVDGNSDRGHEHNGVKWYYDTGWSWGFAPAGAATNLDACDYNGGNQDQAGLRMCWHTGGNAINGGYRCGDNELNGDAGWERILYARDAVGAGQGVVCGAQPGQPSAERCDGIDNDCDGLIDEDDAVDATRWYLDGDNDGFGGATSRTACAQPAGYIARGGDCDDNNGSIHPGAAELCNGIDDNCQGGVDEDFAAQLNQACSVGVGQCAARGVTVCNPNGNPGAAWRPAGVQQNVPVATVLAGGFRECFRDTYNDSGTPLDAILAGCAGAELVTACRPLGSDVLTLAALGDRAQVIQDTGSPSVDGLSDRGHEHNGVKWYFNNSWSWGFAPAGEPTNLNSCDFNGGGQSAAGQRMCWHTGANTIDGGYRCGDNDLNGNAGWERVVYARDVAPVVICGAQAGLPSPERCNGVDDDCDGQTDESDAIDATLWYQDVDGDLFGGQSALLACVQPRGYVNNNRDCNDAVGAINPNAVEICDSIDNNCNRQIDEGVLNACGVCGPVPAEICNGRDDNCDGNVDNGATCPAGQMCSAGACRQSNVLIVYAVPDPTYEVDVRAKLTNIGAFSRVDDFDAAAGTPTTAQLGGYGAVLVYSDAGFADPATLGNNLATYWDAGGRVVVATFANASVGITGRFGTDANGYTLISAAGQTEPASAGAILKVEPASSLLVGVNTLTATASYSSIGVPVNGAVRVANWPDGRPLVLRGVHAGRPIAGLNFYPPSSTIRADFWAGDGANLMRNALQY